MGLKKIIWKLQITYAMYCLQLIAIHIQSKINILRFEYYIFVITDE